jgi:hypothetical protein
MGTQTYRGMVVTDFDGTIYHKGDSFHPRDLKTLRRLGALGFVRVIATGRSMQSIEEVIDRSFPVDYVVFSSGAGVYDLEKGELLLRRVFSAGETVGICRRLLDIGADFMVHHPIPDNHFFHYYHTGRENPDFFRRLAIYRDYASVFDLREIEDLEATQFVIISPPGTNLLQKIASHFEDLSVIWSSSPIDHSSMWIELFPFGSNKGAGVSWLADKLGIGRPTIMAVGNDFNDLHMLEWVPHAYVVANAPEQLRAMFEKVGSCEEAGFTEAFERFYAELFEEKAGKDA